MNPKSLAMMAALVLAPAVAMAIGPEVEEITKAFVVEGVGNRLDFKRLAVDAQLERRP